MRTLDELIEYLEHGLDRAEDPTWVAATILADEDGVALLQDLKYARKCRLHVQKVLSPFEPMEG